MADLSRRENLLTEKKTDLFGLQAKVGELRSEGEQTRGKAEEMKTLPDQNKITVDDWQLQYGIPK